MCLCVHVLGGAWKKAIQQENLPGQINPDFSKGEGENTERMCRTDCECASMGVEVSVLQRDGDAYFGHT